MTSRHQRLSSHLHYQRPDLQNNLSDKLRKSLTYEKLTMSVRITKNLRENLRRTYAKLTTAI